MYMKKLQILFWKTYAKIWYLRPRMHFPQYTDYPIAYIAKDDWEKDFKYPEGIKVLFEWEEKGHIWIVFTRIPEFIHCQTE